MSLLDVDLLPARYPCKRLVEQVVGEGEGFVLVRGLGARTYVASAARHSDLTEPRSLLVVRPPKKVDPAVLKGTALKLMLRFSDSRLSGFAQGRPPPQELTVGDDKQRPS